MDCKLCEKNQAPSGVPQVLEIVNPEKPVLFHKVIFPASIGDDETYPPESLNYRNVLLQYEANNHVYLYSSDGAATLLPTGATDLTKIKEELAQHGIDIDNLQTEVATLQTDLTTETTNRENGDNELRDSIDANTSSLNTLNTTVANQGVQIIALENNIQDTTTELQTDIANEALARQDADDKLQADIDANTSAIDAVKTNLDQAVEQSTAFDADQSTITVTHSKVNLNNNEKTTASEALPVASTAEAGVMNVATFNAVQNNSDLTNALLNGAVAITGLPEEPTQEELSDAWRTATGLDTLINRASILDSTNQKTWTYYTNDTTWYATGAIQEITISQATNNSLGIVKGSEMPGQNYVEADGSLSLNGWDATQSAISTLQSTVSTQGETLTSTVNQLDTTIEDVNDALGDIAAIQADYVSKTNIKTINSETLLGEGKIALPDATDDTDAVNLKQMKDYVSVNAQAPMFMYGEPTLNTQDSLAAQHGVLQIDGIGGATDPQIGLLVLLQFTSSSLPTTDPTSPTMPYPIDFGQIDLKLTGGGAYPIKAQSLNQGYVDWAYLNQGLQLLVMFDGSRWVSLTPIQDLDYMTPEEFNAAWEAA